MPLRAGPVGILTADGRGVRLIDGDVDTGRGFVPSMRGRNLAIEKTSVIYRDIHGIADASGLGLGRVQDGLRAFQCESVFERYVWHFLFPLCES